MNYELLSLYQEFFKTDEKPTKANLTELAVKLSEAIKRPRPWGWHYLNNIIKGYEGFAVTEEMGRAIQILGGELDGQTRLQAKARQKMMFSINGSEEGSIVLGHTIRCRQCHVKIIPVVPWQKYCTIECRREYRKKINDY